MGERVKRLSLLVVATAIVITALVMLRPTFRTAPPRPAALSPSARSPSPAPSSTTPRRLLFRSGVVVGPVVSTQYGDVQVRVTSAHGRITAVQALKLPHNDPMDVELSGPAAQTLEHAVLQAQSANVDMVSGATYTSQGYLQSLQAVLDRLSH